jgi:endonuclease/exonuclease/phosphatase family metal-dependent hydrolase
LASDSIFLEKIEREVRRGGRMAILADIALDSSPAGTLTLVDTHLEDKTTPACRRKQMQVLLESVQAIPNPLVLAGDMNTTSADGSLLSLGYVAKSKITDYRFWGHEVITWGTPLPSLFPIKYFKNYSDPTTRDLKFFFDNKEAALFSDVQKFHFADGGRLRLSRQPFPHRQPHPQAPR